MRDLIRRLAAAVLVAALVSPAVAAFPGHVAKTPDVSPERGTGMDAAAGPALSALVAAAPAALVAPASVPPRVLAATRVVLAERVRPETLRPAFVVKSAPTILRV